MKVTMTMATKVRVNTNVVFFQDGNHKNATYDRLEYRSLTMREIIAQ